MRFIRQNSCNHINKIFNQSHIHSSSPKRKKEKGKREYNHNPSRQNQSTSQSVKNSAKSSKNPGFSSWAFLSDEIHLVFLAVVDLELGQRRRCLGDELAFAKAASVAKELLLEFLGDELLDNDVVGVALGRCQ